MNLEIVRDPEILKKPCSEVTIAELQLPETQKLIEDMLSMVQGYNVAMGGGMIGRQRLDGLAANQVGHNKRIFVVYLNPELLIAAINPQVLQLSSSYRTSTEGCLSLPGKFALQRVDRIVLRAFDRDGQQFERRVDSSFAAFAQHENDHLNGILITDRQKRGKVTFPKYVPA